MSIDLTPTCGEALRDEFDMHPDRFGAVPCIVCRRPVFDTEDGWTDLDGHTDGPDGHDHTNELLVCDTCDQPIPAGTERVCLVNDAHLHCEACVDDCGGCHGVMATEGRDS
ncbi:MAG: hypothetical protein JWM40_378 [Frankiales bacterium]|nr:hypothetical protein [Frankiales bacterium]